MNMTIRRGAQPPRDQPRPGRSVAEGAKAGDVRHDVSPEELAKFCLHAPTAAGSPSSKAAVQRLVAVTLAGLHPRR